LILLIGTECCCGMRTAQLRNLTFVSQSVLQFMQRSFFLFFFLLCLAHDQCGPLRPMIYLHSSLSVGQPLAVYSRSDLWCHRSIFFTSRYIQRDSWGTSVCWHLALYLACYVTTQAGEPTVVRPPNDSQDRKALSFVVITPLRQQTSNIHVQYKTYPKN